MPRPLSQEELVRQIIADFDEFAELIQSYEKNIKSNFSLPEKEPLTKSEVNISPFIPTFQSSNSQSFERRRILSLTALIFALRDRKKGNKLCYNLLNPKNKSNSLDVGREPLRTNILQIYQKFLESEEELNFDLITSQNEAYYVRPGEYEFDQPEVVLVTIPKESSNPDRSLYQYIQHLMAERVGLRGGGSLDATLSHELTHYYIEQNFSGNMLQEEQKQPSLIALNEGAAYAVTYLYTGSFDAPASYHREVEKVDISQLETAAETFLMMTEGENPKDRIAEIRKLAVKTINEGFSEQNFEVINEFISGEIEENFQKVKEFNTARQELMEKIARSLLILGFVSEEEFPSSLDTSVEKSLFQEIDQIIDLTENILRNHEDENLRQIFQNLQNLAEIYKGDREEIHENFLQLEESDVEVVREVKEDHFNRFIVTERDLDRINQDLELYENFIKIAENSIQEIDQILSKIHEEELQETSKLGSENINKLIELTEESHQIVKRSLKDLEEAKNEIESLKNRL